MIFAAALILEREPMQWRHLFGGLLLWVQNAGTVAALGVFIWMLARLIQRRPPGGGSGPGSTPFVVTAAVAVSFLGYVCMGLILLGSALGVQGIARLLPVAGRQPAVSVGDIILVVSGLIALVVALAPVARNLLRLRWGRIWALARLSLKEAIRNRVVMIFAAIALVFLFADWFVPYKAEDQVRNYVRVVYWSMTPLFLLTAGLLGSLSIPNDIKSQSIHTIVTKPVEKFEIVLGRFLGYGLLLTGGLAVVSLLSLGYIVRGVNDAAAQESYTARVPVFGELGFVGTRGESVGREWDYRKYIGGPQSQKPGSERQYAVWIFPEVPSGLGEDGKPVKCEFTFDIFRLSKGEENKGINCTFTFADGRLAPAEVGALLATTTQEQVRRQAELRKQQEKALASVQDPAERERLVKEYAAHRAAIPDELLEEYRVYQEAGFEVTDYHTQSVAVPAALFRKLEESRAADPAAADKPAPALQVLVSVDRDRTSEAQMLGVARRDLYLLAAEKPFWQNFLKGVVGMWCTCMLVLGVAVACSTYLSGIISWLCTMFLFGAGLFNDHLQQLADRQPDVAGPSEALFRLATNRLSAAPLDPSPTFSVLQWGDASFSWLLRFLLNLIPDVNRFDLHQYVANGFDISGPNLLLVDNLIPLVGYLLPWAVLAFYLMKYREIANPT